MTLPQPQPAPAGRPVLDAPEHRSPIGRYGPPGAPDQLIIAHASAATEAAAVAISTLSLPNLTRLLDELTPAQRYGDDEYSLNATHEAVLAADWGWHGEPGQWPFAAQAAAADGMPGDDDLPWGLITPCHWLVSSDKISLVDPQELALDAAESRALFDALLPSFEAEGWQLLWGAPLRWYARHAVLDELKTASLDRVIGRNLDLWLRGGDPQARRLRRLQVEAQMLWHEHPVNQQREAQGALSVNSFWLSGCGRAQALSPSIALPATLPALDERLRTPLLQGDWAAWCDAWHGLDAGPIAQLLQRLQAGHAVSLTLCGERQAQRYLPTQRSLWQRARRVLPGRPRVDAQAVLSAL